MEGAKEEAVQVSGPVGSHILRVWRLRCPQEQSSHLSRHRWAPELNPSVDPIPFCEHSRKEQEPRSKTSSSVLSMGCLFAYTFSMNFYNNPFESSYCQLLHVTEEETEARLKNLALGPTVPKAAGWRSWLVSPLHSSAGRAGQGHRLRAQRELRWPLLAVGLGARCFFSPVKQKRETVPTPRVIEESLRVKALVQADGKVKNKIFRGA